MALSRSTENVSAPALVLDAVAGAGEVVERVEVRVEGVRHLAHGGALGLGAHVRAGVRGHRRARVPQAARRGPHVAPARYHHGGEGVPEVVERAAKAVHPAEGREVLAEPSWVAGQAHSPAFPVHRGRRAPLPSRAPRARRRGAWRRALSPGANYQIGRASCRERV